ncbi:hypothetical protein NJH83_28750 [Pseudomonas chlororaphis]|uniref:hypothetical protein n=1 Tax=Pseudomonas chlororaphis TaxID=587753 RepID=UPI00209B839C|nr:hypothetical protein [Pseudomonas chlororaphis]MCO7614234.1 hypothetical protein [Pseudomonas chlororaphis]
MGSTPGRLVDKRRGSADDPPPSALADVAKALFEVESSLPTQRVLSILKGLVPW